MSNKSYEVGRGKPPKSSQWKKGQSGNPSGKKKATAGSKLALVECMAEQLAKPIAGTVNGKMTSMSVSEAIVAKLFHDLIPAPLTQKLAALKVLNELGVLDLHKLNLQAQAAEEDPGSWFSEEDRRLLEIIEEEVFGGGRDTA